MVDAEMRDSSKLFSFIAGMNSPREIFLDGEHKMITKTDNETFVIFRNGDRFELSYWDLITKYKINRNEHTNQLYLLGRTKFEAQKEKIKLNNFIKIMQEDSRNGILDTLQLANFMDIPSSNIDVWFKESDFNLEMSNIDYHRHELVVGVELECWTELLLEFSPVGK